VSPPPAAPDAGEVAAAYEAESLARCREGARLACILGIVLVTAFGALDLLRFPELFPILARMRLVAVLVLAASLWLLARRVLGEYIRTVAACCSIAIGLMFDALTIFAGGAASPYHLGAGLTILGANLVIPWAPTWATLVSSVIVAGYVVCGQLGTRVGGGQQFVSNLFYLSGTAVIAIFTATMRERLRWREFRARRDLIEADRHKSDFFASMSHELRTPLHVMIGYADILLESALDAPGDEARRLVEGSRRQGLLLNRLISDLLDYSKLEAGKMDVSVEPGAILEAVEHTAESFRPVAERRGLRLVTYVAPDLPEVASDKRRVQQILNNLVGNAIKFTHRGEIRIELVPAATLRATTGSDVVVLGAVATGTPPPLPRRGVAIAVSDTGIGMRQDDLSRLAHDFQQLDTAERYGGTGLGLSFSRKLVALLGGSIAVRSRQGEGSTFMVFLPEGSSASPEPRAEAGAPSDSRAA
jgi:signal transduction histidine kinase